MHLPSSIASLIYLSVVAYLFRRDFREKPNVTAALWLPISWVFFSGTRFISQWMGLFGLNFGGVNLEEGSPVDAVYFFAVILVGLWVLGRRRVQLAEFVRRNRWVTIYLAYCLVAVVWSDFSLVAFKRWTKLLGQPVMVLIVLTEPDPREAVVRLFKRLAYVVIPVSVLFIKYFPEWGRTYDLWTGFPANCGITPDKNILGFDCFILGYFFFWHFLGVWQAEKSRARRNELILCGAFLATIFWLMHMAQSSTPFVSFLVAMVITLALGLKSFKKEALTVYVAVIIAVGVIAEFGFHASGLVIEMLGKDPTLTGRTDIWKILVHWDINPVLGTGFESFWLGERREKLWDMFPVLFLNSAHNGYLETYLCLGLAGLFITLGMVFSTYARARRELFRDFEFARFRLSYLVVFLIYNWTEVGFRTHSVPFFGFFLVAIEYPWAGAVSSWHPLAAQKPPAEADYEF